MLHCLAEHRKLFPAAVKPITKFIAVAAQVLYGNLVEGAIDAALEQAESVLNRIGVDFAPRIALVVIDDAMRSGSARFAVRAQDAIRLISARAATRRERAIYEE